MPETLTESTTAAPAATTTTAAPEAFTESRIGGINVGGNTVTQATEHLPEIQRSLIRWLHDHARRMRWGWVELSAAVGLDSSTLFRVFNDKYRYPAASTKAGQRIAVDSICEKIAKLKKEETIHGTTENPDFVSTSVSKRIEWLVGRCAAHHRMGFIFGASQVGKTWSLKEYARQHNGGATTYVEMPPSSGVQLMAKCIAKGLHVSPNTCFDNLQTDIIEALDSSKTLILDEVQRVFTTYQKTSVMRCLDTLRYIHDQTKCGLVLCGTDVFRDQIKAGEFVKYLSQFNRRGKSYILQLPTEPPREDLDALAERKGLARATGEAEQIMLHIAKQDGLGVFAMRLQDAEELAAGRKERLAWSHFVRAYAITEKAAAVLGPQY